MKTNEIRIGGVYLAKVSGAVQRVRVDEIFEHWTHRGNASTSRYAWRCTNIATGRRIVVKSSQRFRAAAHAPPAAGTPEPTSALGIPAVVYEAQRDSRADCDRADYGGAFDGNSVSSDADPGL